MLVLALDTTTRQGSIALARDGALLATYMGDAAITHGERLPGDLVRVLDAHGVRIADVDVFAVAAGPGSFTGLRIGIATMQGLALANEKSLVGVSALDAINAAVSAPASAPQGGATARLAEARPADEDERRRQLSALSSTLSPPPSAPHPREVAVWMDAQRGQVFSAVYDARDVVEAALVDKPADILRRWAHERMHPRAFAGDGATAYRDLIRAAIADAIIVEPLPPLAPAIAMAAAAHVGEHGASAPDTIRPIYIRRSDAELARDRAASQSASAPPALRRD